MPKSKGRKVKRNTQMRRTHDPLGLNQLSDPITAWNQHAETLSVDQFYSEWCHLRLGADEHQRALAAATMMWVGAGDPGGSSAGMFQCWHACYLIGKGMTALGYSYSLLTVAVDVCRPDGQVIDRISSLSPRHEGNHWTGHTVLHIPAMTTIFDPTIGQGRFATTPLLRAPAILADPRLTRQAPPGSQFIIRRDPTTILVYTVTNEGERPEDHPGHEAQKRHLDEQFERLAATFVPHARNMQQRHSRM